MIKLFIVFAPATQKAKPTDMNDHTVDNAELSGANGRKTNAIDY